MGHASVRGTAIGVSTALCLTSISAAGQAPEPEGPLPRGRLSAGGLAGASSLFGGNNENASANLLGLYVRGGFQWTRGLGTEIEGAAGTSVLTSSIYGGAFLDLVPLDWLSIALGPVLGKDYGGYNLGICEGLTCSAVSDKNVTYLSGAARIDFFVADHWNRYGGRGVDLGVELQIGGPTSTVRENTSGGRLGCYFTVGYAVY